MTQYNFFHLHKIFYSLQADSLILDLADLTGGIAFFNGDDYRALAVIDPTGSDTVHNADNSITLVTILDVIGTTPLDPGTGWDVAGIANATVDHTLVRKPTISKPNADWASSAGTDAENSEWVVLPKDEFFSVGKHIFGVTPEPTQIPMNFVATAFGTDMELTWELDLSNLDGASILPEGYLIIGDTVNSFVDPTDGQMNGINDDKGFIAFVPHMGPANAPQNAWFPRLMTETIYYFKIYSFTNAGPFIDYKVDVTAPVATDTTGRQRQVIDVAGFEAGQFVSWMPFNVSSNRDWKVLSGDGAGGSGYFAEMNGFGEDTLSNDWLISRPFNLTLFLEEEMEFSTRYKYGNGQLTELTLHYSTDYESGDPTSAKWTELQFTKPLDTEAETWIHSGMVDLSGIDHPSVRLAIVYQSEDGNLTRWRLDEIKISGIVDPNADLPPMVRDMKRDYKVPTADQDLIITAEIMEDDSVSSAKLYYSVNHSEPATMIEMTEVDDSTFTATIPESAYGDGDLLEYWVEAFDNASPAPQSSKGFTHALLTGNTDIGGLKAMDGQGAMVNINLIARVTGVASTTSDTYSTGRTDFYMQDSTGGINVYNSGSPLTVIARGNSYSVTGRLIEFNGLAEISPIDLPDDIIDHGAVGEVEPKTMTIAELNANWENYEGTLVQILAVEPTDGSPIWPGATNFGNMYVMDASGDSITLRIDTDTQLQNELEPTWPIDVRGVLVEYSTNLIPYQILPRDVNDLGTVPVSVEETSIPTEFGLSQNYPNPFNPTTTIRVALPKESHVVLNIYNILGEKVKTLANELMPAGYSNFTFDASNLNSGMYIYRVEAGDFVEVKKMILLK